MVSEWVCVVSEWLCVVSDLACLVSEWFVCFQNGFACFKVWFVVVSDLFCMVQIGSCCGLKVFQSGLCDFATALCGSKVGMCGVALFGFSIGFAMVSELACCGFQGGFIVLPGRVDLDRVCCCFRLGSSRFRMASRGFIGVCVLRFQIGFMWFDIWFVVVSGWSCLVSE